MEDLKKKMLIGGVVGGVLGGAISMVRERFESSGALTEEEKRLHDKEMMRRERELDTRVAQEEMGPHPLGYSKKSRASLKLELDKSRKNRRSPSLNKDPELANDIFRFVQDTSFSPNLYMPPRYVDSVLHVASRIRAGKQYSSLSASNTESAIMSVRHSASMAGNKSIVNRCDDLMTRIGYYNREVNNNFDFEY